MTTTVIRSETGKRAVIVLHSEGGNYHARLWVNVAEGEYGTQDASATLVARSFTTQRGVERWAQKMLAG